MTSVLDVAWYFVKKGNGDNSITQLKLQKLCYYAQGFHLAIFGVRLFVEDIEAWDYGPVVCELRVIHANRGAETIYPEEPAFGAPIIQRSIIALLDNIWSEFGHNTAGRLVDMTHGERPWIEAYQKGRNTKISETTMRDEFTPRRGQMINVKELQSNDDPIADVFLKNGDVAKMPLSQVEDFIEKNGDLVGPGRLNARGKRRVVKELI
jgi:uncharacterized phage-associated protein